MANYASPGVYVEQTPSSVMPIEGAGTSTAGFIGIYKNDPPGPDGKPLVAPTGAVLCTHFTEFKSLFGDFSNEGGHSNLAHAVYGFFNNGGTRCYVARAKNVADVKEVLERFEAIGEISMVAAPGATDATTQESLISHCENMKERIALIDGPRETAPGNLNKEATPPDSPPLSKRSSYAACYYPWLQVFDPATQDDPLTKGLKYVPPVGHVAGIYARVDATRGVHKAPANEPVRGALDVRWPISTSLQDGLNPEGINCIRDLDGTIKVWGARTRADSSEADFRYVNVRRLFCYLRDSIDGGLQWAVFEPNNPELWARITRNTRAFLTQVWSTGALFGATPEEAFYVKCDAENNPPAERDVGRVITEIGVAITRPAEFVIFKIGQWSGPTSQ
ncbi:phage tail sheath family protein [Archangium violaceum]|uniref:Tail protein n=1 Tax=Archangium violaceum Cb vi76 TaxID=1406225 RepID=A0A084T297_9BACT|nr:phage tail sheath subtilisin-like domain-containing protein [Archangium violaceum]KFA94832.1 tail protein [Archangium violaceum Cb vi76]